MKHSKRINRLLVGAWLIVLLSTLIAPLWAQSTDSVYHVGTQFTMSLPAGWAVYDQTEIVTGKPGQFGIIIFSQESLSKSGEVGADPARMTLADRGEMPAFHVERIKPDKGMSCQQFSERSGRWIKGRVSNDPVFVRGAVGFVLRKDEAEVAGCKGYKVYGDNRLTKWSADVRAVSDGKVLYLFTLRHRTENMDKSREFFEKAIASLKLME